MLLSPQVKGPFKVVFGSLKVSMSAFSEVYKPPAFKKRVIAMME
jgi:hypothetical protein